MADSSAQAVAYWTKGEKQQYSIEHKKMKVLHNDTSIQSHIKYDIEITVIDSTEKSYTLKWNILKSENLHIDSNAFDFIPTNCPNIKFLYRTDETGIFQELINWEEIQKTMFQLVESLFTPKMTEKERVDILAKVKQQFQTQEQISHYFTKEIQQFHHFFGLKYSLNSEASGKTEVPNQLGGKPFDADYQLYMDEINAEENTYVVRYVQEVDSIQLAAVTKEFLLKLNPNWEDGSFDQYAALKNDLEIATRMHESGWVIYSISTMNISVGESLSIEERIIEIK